MVYADPDHLVQIIAASSIFQQQEQGQYLEPVTSVAGNSNTGQVTLVSRGG